jgi:hypothetical protein
MSRPRCCLGCGRPPVPKRHRAGDRALCVRCQRERQDIVAERLAMLDNTERSTDEKPS